MLWNEDQSPRVKKERKPTLRGKWESVFSGRHMNNVPQETHVVSVMTHKPLEIVAKVRDEKDDRLLLHPIRRQNRLTERDKNPQRDQLKKRNALWTRMKFHADSKSVKNPTCKFWHPPVCQNCKSVYMATNNVSDMLRQTESPTKGQIKVVQKDQLRYWRSPYSWIVYLKILIRESLFNVNLECWDRNTPSKKGPIARNYPKVCASWA